MATTGGTAGRTAAMDGPSPGALLRSVSLALLAGALSGLAAGVLSRAAMRLLTLTSTDDARGLLTDDQALVGQVTLGGSLFVVLATAVVGAVVGPLYLVARRGLPGSRRGRLLGSAGLGAASGALVLVHEADTFDYRVLGPHWLSVALFLAVPAVLAALVAAAVETWDRSDGWFHTGPPGLTLLPLVVLLVPFVGVPVGAGVLVALVVRAAPPLRALWRSRGVTVLAVAVAVAIALVGVADLVTDVSSMARAG
jgi:hypothetical protein